MGDGIYRSIKPKPNVLVVNIGLMLMRFTNNILKATWHRVLDIGVDRYSSPFFLEPRYAAEIPSSLEKIDVPNDEKVIYGDWLIEAIKRYGEFANIKNKKPKLSDLQKEESSK